MKWNIRNYSMKRRLLPKRQFCVSPYFPYIASWRTNARVRTCNESKEHRGKVYVFSRGWDIAAKDKPPFTDQRMGCCGRMRMENLFVISMRICLSGINNDIRYWFGYHLLVLPITDTCRQPTQNHHVFMMRIPFIFSFYLLLFTTELKSIVVFPQNSKK